MISSYPFAKLHDSSYVTSGFQDTLRKNLLVQHHFFLIVLYYSFNPSVFPSTKKTSKFWELIASVCERPLMYLNLSSPLFDANNRNPKGSPRFKCNIVTHCNSLTLNLFIFFFCSLSLSLSLSFDWFTIQETMIKMCLWPPRTFSFLLHHHLLFFTRLLQWT